MVEQLVPRLVEDAREAEHHQAQREQSSVQPVEENQRKERCSREGPEPPEVNIFVSVAGY